MAKGEVEAIQKKSIWAGWNVYNSSLLPNAWFETQCRDILLRNSPLFSLFCKDNTQSFDDLQN